MGNRHWEETTVINRRGRWRYGGGLQGKGLEGSVVRILAGGQGVLDTEKTIGCLKGETGMQVIDWRCGLENINMIKECMLWIGIGLQIGYNGSTHVLQIKHKGAQAG